MLCIISFALATVALLQWITSPFFTSSKTTTPQEKKGPQHAFLQPSDKYQAIGQQLFTLGSAPWKLELPDLRTQLQYYGMNGRPDASKDKTLFHLSLPGMKYPHPVRFDQPVYLSYQKEEGQFVLSPDNSKTPLWLVLEGDETEIDVTVHMVDEEGTPLTGSPLFTHFRLTAKEWSRPLTTQGKGWELGSFRVDGTLLARQQAKWYGQDRFLERLGGEDYASFAGKQRIDFGEGDSLYSVFVALHDFLIWKEGRWRAVPPDFDSSTYPLLYVKKIDERLMCFDLWDEHGQKKMPLTLLKSNEAWSKEAFMRSFHFLGARTKTQCVCEMDEQRLLLQPNDWLLLTEEGWQKILTEEEIDAFVDRKKQGVLLVFDGVQKQGEHQVLQATLFSTSRAFMEEMSFSIQQAKGSANETLSPQEPSTPPFPEAYDACSWRGEGRP